MTSASVANPDAALGSIHVTKHGGVWPAHQKSVAMPAEANKRVLAVQNAAEMLGSLRPSSTPTGATSPSLLAVKSPASQQRIPSNAAAVFGTPSAGAKSAALKSPSTASFAFQPPFNSRVRAPANGQLAALKTPQDQSADTAPATGYCTKLSEHGPTPDAAGAGAGRERRESAAGEESCACKKDVAALQKKLDQALKERADVQRLQRQTVARAERAESESTSARAELTRTRKLSEQLSGELRALGGAGGNDGGAAATAAVRPGQGAATGDGDGGRVAAAGRGAACGAPSTAEAGTNTDALAAAAGSAPAALVAAARGSRASKGAGAGPEADHNAASHGWQTEETGMSHQLLKEVVAAQKAELAGVKVQLQARQDEAADLQGQLKRSKMAAMESEGRVFTLQAEAEEGKRKLLLSQSALRQAKEKAAEDERTLMTMFHTQIVSLEREMAAMSRKSASMGHDRADLEEEMSKLRQEVEVARQEAAAARQLVQRAGQLHTAQAAALAAAAAAAATGPGAPGGGVPRGTVGEFVQNRDQRNRPRRISVAGRAATAERGGGRGRGGGKARLVSAGPGERRGVGQDADALWAMHQQLKAKEEQLQNAQRSAEAARAEAAERLKRMLSLEEELSRVEGKDGELVYVPADASGSGWRDATGAPPAATPPPSIMHTKAVMQRYGVSGDGKDSYKGGGGGGGGNSGAPGKDGDSYKNQMHTLRGALQDAHRRLSLVAKTAKAFTADKPLEAEAATAATGTPLSSESSTSSIGDAKPNV